MCSAIFESLYAYGQTDGQNNNNWRSSELGNIQN